MSVKYFIGLMSGTSLDGIDVALVSFEKTQPTLVSRHSHPFPSKLRKTLLNMINPLWTGSFLQIGTINQELGYLFADSVNALLNKSGISSHRITAIGSHGHTIWHNPTGRLPFSTQLGDANIIAELTGIITIADFRSRDIAAGGQGAPLVPAFHYHSLNQPDKNRVILNIGGIANITFLPSNQNSKDIYGVDTGPGNGLMDAWIDRKIGNNYDKDGAWAKSGKVIPQALSILLKDPYFKRKAPKSTGKEAFNLLWLEEQLGNILPNSDPADIQNTLLELTVRSIADHIPNDCEEIFVCGGGVHNKYLMHRLQEQLPSIPIKSTNILGIDPDWMEAIAFAWLAKQTISGKAGNLPITTGAKGLRILGATYPALPLPN